jgi:hypothetical protein
VLWTIRWFQIWVRTHIIWNRYWSTKISNNSGALETLITMKLITTPEIFKTWSPNLYWNFSNECHKLYKILTTIKVTMPSTPTDSYKSIKTLLTQANKNVSQEMTKQWNRTCVLSTDKTLWN